MEYDEYTETIGALYDSIIDVSHEYGISNQEDEFIKDFSYVMESVRAMVERQFDIEHPFHDVVDRKLKLDKDENGVVVNIRWEEN